MLKFSKANTKLAILAQHLEIKKSEIVSFDLPAGWSCPAANICKTKANRETGKLTKFGPITCYATKAEALYPNTRIMRWSNFDALTACKSDIFKMADLLNESLPKQAKIVRIHSSGDFYRPEYFHAWDMMATNHPEIVFFAYTKIMDYAITDKADNFYVQYSFGGRHDNRWNESIPTCFIGTKTDTYPGIERVCETHEKGYQDYLAIIGRKSFVIEVH